MSAQTSTAITPLFLDPKRNGAFGDTAAPSATAAAVVDPTSGQTINTATGQPAIDPAQQEATMTAQGDAQSAQLQAQSAEQQAASAQQQAQLQAQQKDLEIQQAQQAAEATKAELERTKQQVKTQEKQMAEATKQQPGPPQISPVVQKRVAAVTKSVKPMDTSALMAMKLASASLRPRGYAGGHDFKTQQKLQGARQLHGASAPRTATAEEMQPYQRHNGNDWSNYKPRDNADPSNLSGSWGVASGPRYMDEINAARDRITARGDDLSAYGVTPVAPPTAAPAQGGGTGVMQVGGTSNRAPGIYQNGQLMVKDPNTQRYVPAGAQAPAPAQVASAPTPTPQTPAPAVSPPAQPTPPPPVTPTVAPPAPAINPPAQPTNPQPMAAPPAPLPSPFTSPNGAVALGSAAPVINDAATSQAAPSPQPAGNDTRSIGGQQTTPSPQYDRTGSGQRISGTPYDRSGSGARISSGQQPPHTGDGVPARSPEGVALQKTFRPPGSSGPLAPTGPVGPLLPPGNPLGLPPAMTPEQMPNFGDMGLSELDPNIQLQLLYQLLGQANQGGYQGLGSLGGGFKSAAAPPKPYAPLPAGPTAPKAPYKFDVPDAARMLANPATPPREQSWAYDQAARHYFANNGAGSHDQAADYFASQYPGQPAGQQIAERVRGLSNDQIRQQHRGEQQHHMPVDTYRNMWNQGEGFLGKAKSLAMMGSGLTLGKSLTDTALGGWRDWTGTANQELQDQLIPQQSQYGSMANMSPEQRQQRIFTELDAIENRGKDIDAWNHRWMGDQDDQGAGLSNLMSGFFEQGAPTPPDPNQQDPMVNPWSSYWNAAPEGLGRTLAGATMTTPLPLMYAAATSPTLRKHVTADGKYALEQSMQAAGDTMDSVRKFGEGDIKGGLGEAGNALLEGYVARMGAKYLKPGQEALSRLPFYVVGGADAYQPTESRGAAIDSGAYEGGAVNTPGSASEGIIPTLLGSKTQDVAIPEKIKALMAPTAGESVGGMSAIGDEITKATGAAPGSPAWVQFLSMLLPFLAPLFARMGGGGDGNMASTADSYYGPEFYGGAI